MVERLNGQTIEQCLAEEARCHRHETRYQQHAATHSTRTAPASIPDHPVMKGHATILTALVKQSVHEAALGADELALRAVESNVRPRLNSCVFLDTERA